MTGAIGLLTVYLESFTYFGIILVLFICGLGVPIPEDIVLVIGGYLAYQGFTSLPQTVIIALVGIMVGDVTLYTIGSRFGTGILNHHRLSRLCTEDRLKKAQGYLRRYGKRTIFFARFMCGVRGGVYVLAGALKMRLLDFFLMDFLAALLSVPFFVYLGYYFGSHIDTAFLMARKGSHIIIALLIIAALLFITWNYLKRNKNPEA